MKRAWVGSDRRDRLPPDWPQRRNATLERDPVCTCPGCPRCTEAGCPRMSTDADHVLPIDDHSLTNLAGKCRECHAWKSSREGVDARARLAVHARRPVERHPGLKSN